MNSKQLACIFLVLYVAVLATSFSIVKFSAHPEEEQKTDDLVYVALEMPEPEQKEKKEKKIKVKERSKQKSKKDKGKNNNVSSKENNNPSSDPKKKTNDALEANGKEEKLQTVDQNALFTTHIQGNRAPIAQGNAGEESDKTAGTSHRDGFDGSGVTVPGGAGGSASPEDWADGIEPYIDKSKIKQQGVLWLQVKVDENGKVLDAWVDLNKQHGISDPTTRNAIIEAFKTTDIRFEKGKPGTYPYRYWCKQD